MAARSLGSLTLDLVAKTGGFEQGLDRAGRSVKNLQDAAKKQQDELDKLLGKIDPVVGRLGDLDKMEQQLRAHGKARLLPSDDFAEYLDKLNKMRDGLTRATDANGKYTMSARAQAAAMRGIPAQFTDIAVSLQGGQKPLTVLLQQGGQLKDMFGGIGPAAKALGGYVIGLINPFTLAAAAVGVLAIAYKEGSDETTAYTKALTLTGNFAGTSSTQLNELAHSLGSTVGTTGAAADVLTKLAGTGKIASSSFDDIGRAALLMQEVTGTSVDKTIAEFVKLSDEPTKASKELNEQFHYLTATTYEQIAALEKAGDKAGAAALAEKSYADALTTRSEDIKGSLGTIESAWNTVEKGAKRAWDALLDIGREDTLEQKLDKLANKLQAVNNAKNVPLFTDVEAQGAMALAPDVSGGAEGVQKDIQKAFQDYQDKTEAALKAGAAGAAAQAGIDAYDNIQKQIDKTDSKAEKLRKALALDDVWVKNARAGGLTVTQAQVDSLRKQTEEEFKEPAKTPKAYQDDAGTKMLQTLRDQQATLQDQLDSTGKLTEAEKQRATFVQQIADLKGKQVLTADQKSLLADQDAIKAQLDKNVALATEIAHREDIQKLAERSAQLQESIANSLSSQQEQFSRQLDGAGQGSQTRERLEAQKSIYKEYQRYQEQLDKATPKDLLGSDEYQGAVAKIKAGQDQALKASQDYYAELDKQRGDWTLGAKDAFQDYLDSAKDVAGQTKSLFGNAFQSMEDSVLQFATTGKASFADFAKSVLTDLARIALKSAESSALSGLLGLAGSVASSYFGGSAAPAATTTAVGASSYTFNPQLNTSGLTYQALGGAWQRGVKMFAKGASFTNSIVNSPTAFGMSGGGTGVMGEAGPEAVMPLSRSADGSLGVRVSGLGSGSASTVTAVIQQTIVTGDTSGSADADATTSQATVKAIAAAAKQGAQDQIAKELKPGGQIWAAVNGRS